MQTDRRTTECTQCRGKIEVGDWFAGGQVECPHCKTTCTVFSADCRAEPSIEEPPLPAHAPILQPTTDLLREMVTQQTTTNNLLKQTIEQNTKLQYLMDSLWTTIIFAMILAFLVVPACRSFNEFRREEKEQLRRQLGLSCVPRPLNGQRDHPPSGLVARLAGLRQPADDFVDPLEADVRPPLVHARGETAVAATQHLAEFRARSGWQSWP